jgi:hypothetical protein
MAYIRTDVKCGSNEDISCFFCGTCVHECDLQVRGDLTRVTRVYCDNCLTDYIQAREIAKLTFEEQNKLDN